MKPRIFVSSTFYDLKYVREELANFIRLHDFEPVMFEDGDIGYDVGRELDKSCYEAMKSADMAILIIGGQYGTNASEQDTTKVEEFISITQKEFASAVNDGVPVFAFVDSNVSAEWNVYKMNKEKFKDNPEYITFSATKDIRIFNFINSIYGLNIIPVNNFSKVSDIKDYLSKQWSDMFKKYLSQCKEKREIETIKSSIAKLESLVNSMSVMLDAVGENVLEKDSNEYTDVKKKQKTLEICNKIGNIFLFRDFLFTDCRQRANDLLSMLFSLNIELKSQGFNLYNMTEEINVKIEVIVEKFLYNYKFNPIFVGYGNLYMLDELCRVIENEQLEEPIIELLSKGYFDNFL
ncbi:MAG: DUF4062 domain-containing protein [Oscillospiraceae bacterium]|nr:DUF4062 domain-containing protein [Oscillospiraceae bacterium]